MINAKTVEELAGALDTHWPLLASRRERSANELVRIEDACRKLIVPDTSLVVFGSLARRAFNDSSDIDWTLLVDGITIPEHATIARDIGYVLDRLKAKSHGRTGTFGNIASSHNLTHFIGGDGDTNANTTRHSLLFAKNVVCTRMESSR